MNCFPEQLLEEEERLKKLVKILKERSSSYPGGQLEAADVKGRPQYYLKEESDSHKRKYLQKKDLEIAQAIAQRDYERRLLKELESRLQVIEKARKAYEKTAPEEVVNHFSIARQILIDPLILPREEYARRWQNSEYEKKPFPENYPEFYSAKGERVRSKTEKIIADTLYRYRVPYRYEAPLQLAGFGLIHPDFQVLNVRTGKEYYWEHLGMMDDEQYFREAMIRISAYEKNNILPGPDLILTWETKSLPLNMKVLDNRIQSLLL